jgi:uncharacterized cupin superfamily protein
MSEQQPIVVNVDDAGEIERLAGNHWGAAYKILTPSMRPRGGKLGVNLIRVPPGRSCCPYHAHRLEDEVFYVLAGRGLFRYGDETRQIGPGDCISCPAGTGVAHQLANPFDEDLLYLAIGNHEPEEVCSYPDNGKVLVRGLGAIGRLAPAEYLDGEPDPPMIFADHE